jgi:DHA3 family tetracycline resistance protein-like MFS transporter
LKRWEAYKAYLVLRSISALLFAMIFTYSSVYQVTAVQLSALQLVLVGTMLELTVFVFEVPTGVVADVYSRRLSVIIGYLLIGLGFIVEGAVPLFATILLAQVLWGIGYTFTSGATEAWITDEIGEKAAGQAFLRGGQAGQIGALAGIGISMALASVQVNLPILVGGVLLMGLGTFLALVMPENRFQPAPQEDRNTWQNIVRTFRDGLRMVKKRPVLKTILLVGLFYGLYSEGLDRLWVKHLIEDISLPALGNIDPLMWFGLIRAAGMVISTGSIEVVRKRLNTGSTTSMVKTLFVITSILIVGVVGFAWARGFVIALLAYWVIVAARSIIEPIYTAWVNQRLDSAVRATVLSMSGQVDAIGQILGGPVVGLIGNLISVRAAITVSGVLLTPVLGLYGRALRRGEEAGDVSAAI